MVVETWLLISMFVVFAGLLLIGVQVSYALFGTAVLFTAVAIFADEHLDTATGLDFDFFGLVIKRIYAVMTNWILIAGTLFIFMGHMLDKSGIAERLLHSMQELFGGIKSFDWGPAEPVGAVLPVPSFDRYGSEGGGA